MSLPLADYELGSVEVSPLPGGTINRVYRAASNRGIFVLKEYGGSRPTSERMAEICAAQELARTAGLPVPALIANRAGELYTEREGAFFTLSEFVSGRLYAPGEMPSSAAFEMGQTLGRLLGVLSRLSAPEPSTLPDPITVRVRLETLLSQARSRSADPVDAKAVAILEAKLRQMQAFSEAPTPAKAQWIHGDYEWRNVLFDGQDRVAAIIDFDNLQYASPVRDVLRCLELSFPGWSEAASRYCEGYFLAAKPPLEEVRGYVPLWLYLSACRVWPLDARYLEPERYDQRWDEFIEPNVWESQRDRVDTALVEISERAARA